MRAGSGQVLRDRNAVLFIGVSLLSGFGGAVMSLAAGVWVFGLSGSSSLAALAGFCFYVPTLFGPILGAVVDRLPRRPLLVGTNLVTAGSLLSLLTVRSAGQIWLVFTVMLAYGVSFVLLDAGESALLPAALPTTALGDVNTLLFAPVAVAIPIGAALIWADHRLPLFLAATVCLISAALPLVRTATDDVRSRSA